MTKRSRLFTGLISFAVVAGLLLTPFATAEAALDKNRIIDDQLFDNHGSMSAPQINTFLNGFPHSCISPNSGFDALLPTGYSPSGGYTYNSGYQTAGTIIATAASVYGINPQVLLVTLQKEQSLVAGGPTYCNNGDEHKYAAAAGYGCPDGGSKYNYSGLSLYRRNGVVRSSVSPTCVNTASKAGFSQQVIRAAWLLKFGQQRSKGNVGWAVIKGSWDNSDDPESCYSGPMTKGTFQTCPSGSATYYDGYHTIDGQAIRIDTGAAAGLYWYTPHFHGNELFSNTFTAWFGSPILGCDPNEPPMPQVVSLYNPATYEHMYTAYRCEAQTVGFKMKFNYEGAAFNTTSTSVPGHVPIHRLYNAKARDHMWTAYQSEIDFLTQKAGYVYEGLAFYTAPQPAAKLVVWRLYNPKTFQHVWTSSQDVINATTKYGGYKIEGPAFYSQ